MKYDLSFSITMDERTLADALEQAAHVSDVITDLGGAVTHVSLNRQYECVPPGLVGATVAGETS